MKHPSKRFSLCMLLLSCSSLIRAEQDAPLSLSLVTLTAGQGEGFEARDRASHAIGRSLPAQEVAALRRFLLRKPADDGANADELASLKNNAADALLNQAQFPHGLLADLEAAFVDEEQGETWREYVVQKIPELVKRASAAERERGLAFLRERLADTRYIYSGTALLGMQRLHEHSPALVEGREVAEASKRILDSGDQSQASKLTALQILARHRRDEARSIARSWLAGDVSVMLRVSAMATLGEVGDATDRDMIARYASSPELRLRTAARAALAKLDKHP